MTQRLRYSPEIRREAIELYEADTPLAQIAALPGFPTTQTLSRWLAEDGFEVVRYGKSAGTRYSEETRQEAVQRYQQGASITAIAKLNRMPNNPKVIRHWLHQAGIRIERRPAIVYPRREILKKLRAGVPRNTIAKKYGCSLKFLSQLANGKIAVAPVKKTSKKKRKK